MNVWLIEPYYTGSHRAWADGYHSHSRHQVRLLTLPGRFWKWRMQGGAVTLARKAQALSGQPDLLLASDMLNVPAFLALGGDHIARTPVALYFHENQLTYPLPPGEKRDLHYGFINFVSALRAEALYFNSSYHLDTFFDELPRLLKHFPDYNELWAVEALRAKSQVLPLGLDLSCLDAHRPEHAQTGPAQILWNHRWEYDKDPETFFRAVYALAEEGLDFSLVLLGESFRNKPVEFLEARQRLGERIVHFGFAEDAATYGRLLWQADVVISTAKHEFFGASIVEACYCGCLPILPRRLSYPELIPPSVHEQCLYDDFAGLVASLRRAVLRVEETRAFSLHRHLSRFDWRRIAPRCDRLMEEIVAQRGRGRGDLAPDRANR
jgi:glycosyltransferase involved in cell wall biosynthesis